MAEKEKCPACRKTPARCDCFAPQFRYIPLYRRKILGRPARSLEIKKHGLSGYNRDKCRCEVCCIAGRGYRRAYYERTKVLKRKPKESKALTDYGQ